MKIICFFLLVLVSASGIAQTGTTKGFYIDYWKYKPNQKDTIRFEHYSNGLVKLQEIDNYFLLYIYKDHGL